MQKPTARRAEKQATTNTKTNTKTKLAGPRLLSDINRDIQELEAKISSRKKADQEFRAKYNKDESEVSEYHREAMRTYNAKMKTLVAEHDLAFRFERERPCENCGVTALYSLRRACYRKKRLGLLPASTVNTPSSSVSNHSTHSSPTDSPTAMDVSVVSEASETQSESQSVHSVALTNTTNKKKNKWCEDCGVASLGRWCDDCWKQWKDEKKAERDQRFAERQAEKEERAARAKVRDAAKPMPCHGYNCKKMTTRYFCLACHKIDQEYVLR